MGTNSNQGEGNVEAARRFDEAQRAFVEAGKVQEAAKAAEPANAAEADEMKQAEEAGRAHGQASPTSK